MSIGNIKDMERLNHQQLETLKRRQHREIKAMENNHQNYMAELKKTQQSEVIDLQEENQKQVAREVERKEKVLAEMRGHLHHSQELTEKQLKELTDNATKVRDMTRTKLSHDREKIIDGNQLHLEELNHRFQAETRKINIEGKSQINDMTKSMNEQYAGQQGQLQKKVNDQSIAFTKKFNFEGREHQKLMDRAINQNKHERLNLNSRQQSELSKMTEAHTQAVGRRDTEFRKGLKEQDAFFEQKYLVNHESHTKDANNLEGRYYQMMNKMKNNLAQEVKKTKERLDDKFYQFSELRPTWKTTEDGVEIKVKVPDYAKQDLQLSLNGKEALLNFNRRYTDSNESAEGILNKVNKVETFTARIPTGVILNPKTVQSSFDDGVMTYTIKKA